MMNLKPRRRPQCLPAYDYSGEGWYFITLCTQDKKHYFGRVQNDAVILNQCGNIVKQQLLWLERTYDYITIDEYVIMPNHVHVIMVIDHPNDGNTPVGTTLGLSLQSRQNLSLPPKPPIYYRQKNLLSKSICAFKTTSSKLIHRSGLKAFAWQRSFYDRIIRDDREYVTILGLTPLPQNRQKAD